MDTIYALVIILSGTLLPSDDASEEVLSGEVENKTTIYFTTMEACESAYIQTLSNKEQMMVPGMDVTVVIKPCEGIQVTQ
jgi:hypothetical protein